MRVLKEDRGARHCANLQRLIPQTAVGFRKTNIWSLEIEKSFILMRLANNPDTGFCLCVCVCRWFNSGYIFLLWVYPPGRVRQTVSP